MRIDERSQIFCMRACHAIELVRWDEIEHHRGRSREWGEIRRDEGEDFGRYDL